MNDFITKQKQKYKELEKVFCPYINTEVLFTSSGFKHLIWKSNQTVRTIEVIQERMEALNVVVKIISKSGTLQEYEKLDNREFYCFISIIEGKKYKVVIAKYNTNKYKFISVIPKWKTGKRDS